MEVGELFKLSASEAISLIKFSKMSISDLTSSIIDRIEKINPKTDAWVHLNTEQTLIHAKNFDEKMKKGEDISPLFGIPIGIKDIFNTFDFPTEMGSPLWKEFTSGNDARVVYYLRMANANIIGKTETAEFAVHDLGKSKNPYDLDRSPGTSSSGSAVAVATYMVPIALGTQTAGSIIRPASYCGIYGFKPSFGLIPRTGMLKSTDSLDQVGYFARSPQDLELLFDVARVKGRNYPLSDEALNDEKRQTVRDRAWKIKFVKSPTWDQAESYAKKSIENFIHKISTEKIFQIDELTLPREFEVAHNLHETIYAKSLSYYFKEELQKKSLVSNVFYQLASKSKDITVDQFEQAVQHQLKLGQILDKLFKDFDIIISLSTAGHAPLRNEIEKDDPSLIWSMCGIPTISVPAIKTPKGLPMGIQFLSRKYNDKLLLSFVKLLFQKNFINDGPFPKISY